MLATAVLIVREEGADRLTLGRLSERARVSKPVVYDHFATRSALLIALYRWVDTEKVKAFSDEMTRSALEAEDTVKLLAAAYIRCAADIEGEFQAIGAALAGSEEKTAVFEELLVNSVDMFVSVLKPHSTVARAELTRRCIGLVAAGEALAAARLRGRCNEKEAIRTFGILISGALGQGG